MKKSVILYSLLFAFQISAQTVVENINIYRDSYGVPHIHGKTDRDVAYGLAWAHAEDDFKTMQNTFLPSKGLMGSYSGKEGVLMDYLVSLLRCRETAERHYNDLSEEIIQVIEGYIEGVNAYAKSHPDEVLVKNSFPFSVMDYLTGYNLVIHFFSDTGDILGEILNGTVETVEEANIKMEQKTIGSNAFAFSRKIMQNDKTVLNVNTHQPLEGPFSWYEAHVISDEGWNMLGGLFPGAPFPMIGTNENLGWTHTYNYPDLIDVYELKVNPKNKNEYWYNGQWVSFDIEKVQLKMKTKLGFKLKVKKKLIWSEFGPVLKNKKGYFSFQSNAFENISSIDEWYQMNKATNWTEFKTALQMMSIPRFNVMYADKSDSIFYMSLGKVPERSGDLRVNQIMPGDTNAVLSNTFLPFEALPKVLNPSHGYLFNTNNSPFNCAHEEDNVNPKDYEEYRLGYKEDYNNRSRRFEQLISENEGKLSMDDFYTIKYDIQYPDNIWTPSGASVIFKENPSEYPKYEELIELIQNWNHRADTSNIGAAQWAIYYRNYLSLKKMSLSERDLISLCLKKTNKHLMKHFGKLDIQLNVYQRHKREGKELAVPGLTDMIAAMSSAPDKKGKVKPVHGESYIMIIQYSDNGVEIETVLPYGNSRVMSSRHYTDQMKMYARQERKKMSLSLDDAIKSAVRSYHPK
ncbi:MAG: penicillin acylase family protein [Crocinitomicaceae bacterium]|nr:penicillin acylase family protein [Crocinitomicaceae bacterium]